LNVSAFAEDKTTGDLLVTFRNIGTEKVYFKADAVVYEGDASTKIKDDTVYSISPNEGQAVKFPGILRQGSRVVSGANYGSREAFLEKRAEGTYTKQPESAAPVSAGIDMTMILLLVVILLVGIVAYLLLTKKGKEEKKK
jgi:outer membrane protein assembly factor BamB